MTTTRKCYQCDEDLAEIQAMRSQQIKEHAAQSVKEAEKAFADEQARISPQIVSDWDLLDQPVTEEQVETEVETEPVPVDALAETEPQETEPVEETPAPEKKKSATKAKPAAK